MSVLWYENVSIGIQTTSIFIIIFNVWHLLTLLLTVVIIWLFNGGTQDRLHLASTTDVSSRFIIINVYKRSPLLIFKGERVQFTCVVEAPWVSHCISMLDTTTLHVFITRWVPFRLDESLYAYLLLRSNILAAQVILHSTSIGGRWW